MIEAIPLSVIGCYELRPTIIPDERGKFLKTFHEDFFSNAGLETHFVEEYYSCSKAGVIRGMHFQLPPYDHTKIVYCMQGAAFDVLVDLRVNSPTYRKCSTVSLSEDVGNGVYVPKGVAHGFCALKENTILAYKVSTSYYPESDTGILWNSLDIIWPVNDPIVSSRDSKFCPLNEFISPF